MCFVFQVTPHFREKMRDEAKEDMMTIPEKLIPLEDEETKETVFPPDSKAEDDVAS